jgi:O-antigen/teichoic acid export membrane protein
MAKFTGWRGVGQELDEALRTATSRAGWSFLIQGAGVVAAFAVQITLARSLGTHEYGVFAWVSAWMHAAAVVGRCGCDTMTLRFAATYAADGRWGAFNSLVRFANRRATAASLLVGAALFVLMNLLADESAQGLLCVSAVACLWFPILTTNSVRQAALLAVGWLRRSLAPEALIRPLATAVFVAAAAWLGWRSACSAMFMAGLAAVCSLVVGSYWLRTAVPDGRRAATDTAQSIHWPSAASGLLLAGVAYSVLTQVDVIVIGTLSHTANAGVYYATRQIATVVLFGQIAIQIALAPTMAVYHAQNSLQQLQRLVNLVAWSGLTFSLVCGLLLVIFGGRLLSLFGADFGQGLRALYILVLAQVANALGGPVGIIANMTGNESSATWAFLAAIVIVVLVTMLLAPSLGIEGVAIATLAGTITWTTWLNRRIFARTGVVAHPRLTHSLRSPIVAPRAQDRSDSGPG